MHEIVFRSEIIPSFYTLIFFSGMAESAGGVIMGKSQFCIFLAKSLINRLQMLFFPYFHVDDAFYCIASWGV